MPSIETLNSFFSHYYQRRPVNATFTGIHDYDSELPDWSMEGLDETTSEMTSLRSELRTTRNEFPRSEDEDTDSEATDLDCALADAFLEIQIAESSGVHFQRGNPALFTGEAAFSVISLMLRDFAPAAQRLCSLEDRLASIPGFLADARVTIGDRAIPASWTARAVDECSGMIDLFGDGLRKWCARHDLDTDGNDSLTASARLARGAAEEFRSWLGSRPEAPSRSAASGPDFFDLLLRRGHWESRTREELLAEAKARFHEAQDALASMATAVDAKGWPGVSDRLEDLHPTVDEYLSAFQRCWSRCKDVAVGKDLVTWPDFPIRYVPTPDWARGAAPHLYFLNYRSPAPFDDSGVHEYLIPALDHDAPPENASEFLRGVNDSVIKLNHVVHHGAVGHHVQNYYAMRSESRIGQVAAVDCASRIAMFCGGSLAEGWACYATDLMGEAGFLTELELVAEQHSRLRQLARAIVDIQLHQHSWTEADAREFYQERVGMGEVAAAREVTRCSMFPGASIMYWLGTQGIHDLRSELSDATGADFSLRRFHDEFLSYGAIPVQLISRLMTGSDCHE